MRSVLAATVDVHAELIGIYEPVVIGVSQSMQPGLLATIDNDVERIECPKHPLCTAEFYRQSLNFGWCGCGTRRD